MWDCYSRQKDPILSLLKYFFFLLALRRGADGKMHYIYTCQECQYARICMLADYSAEELASYLLSLRGMMRDTEKILMKNIFNSNCSYIFSNLLNSMEMVFDLPKYPI